MKKRFTEQQIIGFLKEVEAGIPVKELCRKYGIGDAAFYGWRSKFGGLQVNAAKRLRELEAENTKLKKLLAEAHLDVEALKVRIVDLTHARRRFGYRRIHDLLRREGVRVNHKRLAAHLEKAMGIGLQDQCAGAILIGITRAH